jgi:hypothetical protein
MLRPASGAWAGTMVACEPRSLARPDSISSTSVKPFTATVTAVDGAGRSPKAAIEVPDVLNQEVWRLHGGEVAAAIEL